MSEIPLQIPYAASPQRVNPQVIIIAGVSAMAGLLFGYDTGVISGALLFIRHEFDMSTRMQEWVTSVVLIGALLGAAGGGTLTDALGRRRVILITAALFILASILTAVAPEVGTLIVGRLLVGLAIGLASFTAPMYISEVSPPQVRGALVSMNQLMITVGIVASYLVGYALASSGGWRWMFGLAGVPAALLFGGMLFLPESPRWLVARGREEEARKVLHRVGVVDVDAEVRDMKTALAAESGRWSELMRPGVRRMLVVGIGLAVFQQVTGINTIIYYAPTIFERAGMQGAAPAILATVGVGVVNVLMTIVAMPLIDRVGRRPLLLWGIAGMVVSLGLLGLAYALPNIPGLAAIAMVCVCLYVAAFAVGLGPVFWLLISEIYPQTVRGKAAGLATMANWGANFVVALTFLTLLSTLGSAGTFWLYAVLSIGAWLFVLILVPETRGRTLEEIAAHELEA